MKEKVFPAIVFICCVFMMTSCQSYRKVPYLQGSDSTEVNLKTLAKKSEIKYQPDDVLAITVNAGSEPSVAAAFNLPLQPIPSQTTYSADENTTIAANYNNNASSGGRQTYLVNKEGNIDFPILGKIHVEGLTREQLESGLKEKLKKYIKEDPVITIRLMNYRISLLGEVNRPGQYSVDRDKINILEALALAGDMTIYGKRDNVLLVREDADGNSKLVRLDLNNANLITSPYYYLHQNDVVYVEPNKAKAKSADISSQTSLLVSLGSILIGVANIIITIAK